MVTSLRAEIERNRSELRVKYGVELPQLIVIVECGQILGCPELHGDDAFFWLEEYEERFEQHLAHGHNWLNLNLDGVHDDSIAIYSMELPSVSTQESTKSRSPHQAPCFNGWRLPSELRKVASIPARFSLRGPKSIAEA